MRRLPQSHDPVDKVVDNLYAVLANEKGVKGQLGRLEKPSVSSFFRGQKEEKMRTGPLSAWLRLATSNEENSGLLIPSDACRLVQGDMEWRRNNTGCQ